MGKGEGGVQLDERIDIHYTCKYINYAKSKLKLSSEGYSGREENAFTMSLTCNGGEAAMN